MIRSLSLLMVINISLSAQLIINIDGRNTTSLNGEWNIIIDPYENGYYNYRYEPHENGYFKNAKQKDKSQLLEYNFDNSEIIEVPGDWNSQKEILLFLRRDRLV